MIFRQGAALVEPDEIFVSDGAKSDSANIQEILRRTVKLRCADPVYPVYVGF